MSEIEKKLQSDVQDFLARGGTITECPSYASVLDYKEKYSMYNKERKKREWVSKEEKRKNT